MTMLKRVEFTCVNCAGPFDGDAMVSQTTFSGQASDFRPLYDDLLATRMHSCPACGFAGYESVFWEQEQVPSEVSRQIAEHLTPTAATIRPSAPRRYEAAARIAEWSGAPDFLVGDLYLKASWCCEAQLEVDADDDEASFRRKAIARFERALATGDLDPGNAAALTYLVGELYRRIGETATAHTWFDRTIALTDGDPDFAELAERQKSDPSNEM
ncbi:DUF2225 domain-containing protein [Catenuloplanes sp. NPDC051500]|uniref:DUF2225 domain-containing protein n=1 Tax=Catenuloplanes sp. NPDC051500 TaxID=3363959 RepID=UPI0037BDC6C4